MTKGRCIPFSFLKELYYGIKKLHPFPAHPSTLRCYQMIPKGSNFQDSCSTSPESWKGNHVERSSVERGGGEGGRARPLPLHTARQNPGTVDSLLRFSRFQEPGGVWRGRGGGARYTPPVPQCMMDAMPVPQGDRLNRASIIATLGRGRGERGGGRASMWDIYHLGNHDGITMNDVGPRVAVGRGLAVGRALRPTTPLIRDVQSPQSVAHADNGVIT